MTIARLKSEVSTLRAEIGYLKGEAGEGDELTDAERSELHSACEVYVKSRDPDEALRVAPLTLREYETASLCSRTWSYKRWRRVAPAVALRTSNSEGKGKARSPY